MTNFNGFDESDLRNLSSPLEAQGFQLDANSIGSVQSSVNLFRGDVNLPLTMVSLPGRNGLNVSVSAFYSSHVQKNVGTTNLYNPTGVLGLGWSMPFEMIVADAGGNASPFGNSYYLYSKGSANLLVQVNAATIDDEAVLSFVCEQYEFWRIQYFSDGERWEVVKEDGVKYVYGGQASGAHALQWGVSRGNWVGSSSLQSGSQYVLAWNLAQVVHFWGDKISFSYQHDDQPIGGSSLAYTRASYLSQIVDIYGRIIDFSYAEKNSSEYQAPHVSIDGTNSAYQDRYETQFLTAVQVSNSAKRPLFSVQCDYALQNLVDEGEPGFTKRFLTGITEVSPSGVSKPGFRFTYKTEKTDPNLGALETVTYPEGGVATYRYAQQSIGAEGGTGATRLSIASPGGVPRVWFGPDFTVVTWYDDSAGQINITPYCWGGGWFPASSAPSVFAKVADDSLRVECAADFFVLSYADTSGSFYVCLYHKDPNRLGEWISTSYSYPAASGVWSPVALGLDFAVFSPSNSSTVYQVTWKAAEQGWESTSIPVTAPYVALCAAENFYTVFSYDINSQQAALFLNYHDGTRQWNSVSIPDTLSNLYLYEKAPLFFWELGSSFATATYVVGVDGDTINYQLKVYQWDALFSNVIVFGPNPYAAKSPTVTDIAARVDDSLIGNAQNVLRFDGQNWIPFQFNVTQSGKDAAAFGYGSDLAVMTQNDGSVVAQQFDPFGLGWTPAAISGGQSPGATAVPPYVNGDFLTIGDCIFRRGTDGSWTPSSGSLPLGIDPKSVQNHAPLYIAFESPSGGSADAGIVLVGNNTIGKALDLPGERYSVEGVAKAGTNLCGPNAFFTYPSSSTFDAAPNLNLYYVVPQTLASGIAEQLDYPVVGLSIHSGLQQSDTAYSYDPVAAIYDPAGEITQYPIVRVYSGATSAPQTARGCDPAPGPYGCTEYYFFNGVSPSTPGVYYPGSAYLYYSILSGQIVYSKTYDSESRLVASSHNFWNKKDQAGGQVLPGCYLQVGRSINTSEVDRLFSLSANPAVITFLNGGDSIPSELQKAIAEAGLPASEKLYSAPELLGQKWIVDDLGNHKIYFALMNDTTGNIDFHGGVSKTVITEYDDSSGLAVKSTTFNRDIDDKLQEIVKQTTYAYNHQPGMRDMHLLTPVAQVTLAMNGVLAASSVINYMDDWGYEPTGHWAPASGYQASFPDAVYDLNKGGDQAGWTKTSQILKRSSKGLVCEGFKRDEIIHSVLFDAYQDYPVAVFANGSVTGGEVSYYGGEPYEADDGWRIEPGHLEPQLTADDCHTGSRSIVLAPGAGSLQSEIGALQPTNGNTKYLFSCWFKTTRDFDTDQGTAQWQLNASAGSKSIVIPPFPIVSSKGEWNYLPMVIDLSPLIGGGPISVTFLATNRKSTQIVLLDELRFSPFLGTFGARVYDALDQVPIAAMSDNGSTSRYVRDSFQNVIATIGPDEKVSGVTAKYQSRNGNSDQFAATDPNAVVTVVGSGEGFYQRMVNGSPQWQEFWTAQSPNPNANWKVVSGALQHLVSQADLLTLVGSQAYTDACLQFHVAPNELITQPIGVRIGSDISARWTPASPSAESSWQLFDEGRQVAILAVTPPHLFSIPITYTAALSSGDVAVIARALAGRGLILSANGVTIRTIQEGVEWAVSDPGNCQSYKVAADSGSLNVSRLSLPEGDWLVVLINNALLLWVNGQLLLKYEFNHTNAPTQDAQARIVTGPIGLFSANKVSYSDIVVFNGPRTSVSYRNGCSQEVQSQVLEDGMAGTGNNCIATGAVFDPLGRVMVKTKAVRYENTLFKHQTNLIKSLDPITGVMSGDAAAYYSPGGGGFSDDKGYPYLRTLYEASPQGRVLATGNPGVDFAITDIGSPTRSHTDQYLYASHQTNNVFKDMKLTAGEFFVKTAIDPNGVVTYILKDKAGRDLVRRTVDVDQPGGFITVGYDYDVNNRMIASRPGNYYGAPSADWSSMVKYNMLGEIVSSNIPDQKYPLQLIYNRQGRCRFIQSPAGIDAHTQYFVYQKFDTIGRIIEVGTVDAPWDSEELQKKSDESSWPQNASWSRRYLYDGDGRGERVGYITGALTSNSIDGEADVVESLTYDACGKVVQHAIQVAGSETATYRTEYAYNSLGQLRQIVYPTSSSTTPSTAVTYAYNSRGQLVAVGSAGGPPDDYAAYTYNAAGRLETETWNHGVGGMHRAYAYNSVGWGTRIADNFFTESLHYTPRSTDVPGYYDGQIAGIDYTFAWNTPPSDYRYDYEYDAVGNLRVAANSALPAGDVGVGQPVTYDANGNFLKVKIGEDLKDYRYRNHTNQVLNTDGTGSAECSYDANGNVTGVSSQIRKSTPAILADPYSGLPKSVLTSSPQSGTLSLLYTSGGRRVQKSFASADGSNATTKIYLSGASARPLLESTRDGKTESKVTYVYGAGGLIAVEYAGSRYFITKDHLGSTRAVINTAGAIPTVAASFDYTPFGAPLRTTGSASFLNYLYAGQEYDPEMDLYNGRARLYDPALGRFYAVDPAGQYPAAYSYAGNNPILYSDPSGQWSLSSWVDDIIGFVVSALEIVAGVALDALSLGTMEAAGGALIGAGVSGGLYTATHMVDFSWGDFGIQQGTGAAIGAVTAGLGEAVASGAEAGADVAGDTASDALANAADAGADVTRAGASSAEEQTSIEMTTLSRQGQCEFEECEDGVTACFVAGTPVLTQQGPVPIESIETGDLVWSFDEKTGRIGLKTVKEIFKRPAADCVQITVEGLHLTVTSEHPFWIEGKGWVNAGELTAGSRLVSRGGCPMLVERRETILGSTEVFNFEVEDWHTYYVGEQQVLVHNICRCFREYLETRAYENELTGVRDELRNRLTRDVGDMVFRDIANTIPRPALNPFLLFVSSERFGLGLLGLGFAGFVAGIAVLKTDQ